YQTLHHSAVVREIRVVKMRGQPQLPGLHRLSITSAGLRVYPRLAEGPPTPRVAGPLRRLGSTGPDEMLGGGVPGGTSVLAVGPTGSGKTALARGFAQEGARAGERTV